jgi:small subunit ribosomal protein S6
MRDYELTFIVKHDLDATNLNMLIEKVKGFVTSEGGVVSKTDMWGLRRLSYPIRKAREGQYIYMSVQLEPKSVARVEQRLKLSEDVLRYLMVLAEDDGKSKDVMGGAETAEPTDAPEVVPAT